MQVIIVMKFITYTEILITIVTPTFVFFSFFFFSLCYQLILVMSQTSPKHYGLKQTTNYFNKSKQTLQGQLGSPNDLSPAQLISAGLIHSYGEWTRYWLVYDQALLHGVSHFPLGYSMPILMMATGIRERGKKSMLGCQSLWLEMASLRTALYGTNKTQEVGNRFHFLMGRNCKVTLNNEKLGQFMYSTYHIRLLYARHCCLYITYFKHITSIILKITHEKGKRKLMFKEVK